VGADVRAGRPQQKGLVVARDAVREHARRGERAGKYHAARELTEERPVLVRHGGRLYRKVWKNAPPSGLDSGPATPNSSTRPLDKPPVDALQRGSRLESAALCEHFEPVLRVAVRRRRRLSQRPDAFRRARARTVWNIRTTTRSWASPG